MAAARNIDNIKYFAPIAISRLYEKQSQFFYNIKEPANFNINQRKAQSEKQFEKMQKMMFAKSKDGEYTAAATTPTKQTPQQKTSYNWLSSQTQQKEELK